MTQETLERPRSITETAMLVKLSISCWSASKLDKNASKELADIHGSDAKRARVTKTLIEKKGSKLGEIMNLDADAKREHERLTVPWDRAIGVIASKGYFDYMSKMREYQSKRETLVKEFVEEYTKLRDKAKEDGQLGTLFNGEDYPHPGLIANKFAFRVNVFPIPEADAVRLKTLTDEQLEEIKKQVEQTNNEKFDEAVKHVMQRLYDKTSFVLEKLKAYRVTISDGKISKEAPFRDSLIGNTLELLDLIPSLNVTGSQEIDNFASEMREKLCVFSPADLRVSEKAREKVIESAEDILARMSYSV